MTNIRRLIYLVLYKFDKIFKNEDPLIIVLCYHSIGPSNWRFSVAISEFQKQISFLLKSRNPISLNDLQAYLAGKKEIKKPSFVLTFDDGYKDTLNVIQWLKNKSIKPTMFILSEQDNVNRKELDTNLPIMDNKDIMKLIKAGWEIGCHSKTHSDFYKLKEHITEETLGAKKEIEKRLGIKVGYFSYPKGRYNRAVLSSVKSAKYSLAVTMDDSFITKKTNPYLIPRIGVDKTHTFEEFTATLSPSVIQLRALVKKMFLAKYL